MSSFFPLMHIQLDGAILQEVRESATALQRVYETFVHSTKENLLQAKKGQLTSTALWL